MVEIGTGKKSFPAMFLSLICPGLGQVYLRKPFKGAILFFGTVLGIFLIYVNSLPVDSVTDLLLVVLEYNGDSGVRLKSKLKNPGSEGYEYTIYKFKKRDLRFRPYWQFRLSGSFQVLIFWAYSIWDGFLGYKGYKRRKSKERKESRTEKEEEP